MDDDKREKILDFLGKNRNILFWERDIIVLTGIGSPKAIGSFLSRNTRRTMTKVERVPYEGGNRPFYGITDCGPGTCYYGWCSPEKYKLKIEGDKCPKSCGGTHKLKFYGVDQVEVKL